MAPQVTPAPCSTPAARAQWRGEPAVHHRGGGRPRPRGGAGAWPGSSSCSRRRPPAWPGPAAGPGGTGTGAASIPRWPGTSREGLEWFEERGLEVRGTAPPLVDFPARYGGRDVLLCWTEGEERIGWYHLARGGLRRPQAGGGAEGLRRPGGRYDLLPMDLSALPICSPSPAGPPAGGRRGVPGRARGGAGRPRRHGQAGQGAGHRGRLRVAGGDPGGDRRRLPAARGRGRGGRRPLPGARR